MRLALVASLLVFSNAALADGGASRSRNVVLWTGESSPWVELLRAEFSVMDVDVIYTHEQPTTDADILSLLSASDAVALVVSDDPAVLWMPACGGGVSATRVPTLPAPGRSTMLISELVWAHARGDCPELPSARPSLNPPRVELATDSAGSLSSPATRSASSRLSVSPNTRSIQTPSRRSTSPSQRPSQHTLEEEEHVEPPSRRRDDYGPFLRIEMLHGRDDFVGPFDFAIGGGWRVHPHLGLVVRGSFAHDTGTPAPIERAMVATASAGVQVVFPVGSWELDIEGGPALIWLRAEFEPNLGHDPSRQTFGGYYFGTSVQMPLTQRLALRLIGRVTNTGRRQDLTLIGRDFGRWGPIVQAGLGIHIDL